MSDIQVRIWKGNVLVRLLLTDIEQLGLSADAFLPPLMLEIPRCSYLPLVIVQIRQHVANFLGNFVGDDADIWFQTSEGFPLKWHYPMGLLSDLYNAPSPWTLKVKWSEFPREEIVKIPLHSLDAPQDFFMAALKEADYMRHGNVKKMMGLSKEDQTTLWQSLVKNDFNRYIQVKQLLDSSEYRCYPLRIYFEGHPVIQEPISGLETTLKDVISQTIPENLQKENIQVILHGISIPLDTSLYWLSQNMSYADHFLHLVILKC